MPTLVAVVVLICSSPALIAQQGSSSDQQPMLNELRQIRQLLDVLVSRTGSAPVQRPTGAGAVPDASVTLTRLSGYGLGSPAAPVTVVEFTDLQCPFCRQFHATVFERLKTDFIDTGKVRFITRDFPLEQLHPLAMLAARASRCAGEQERFWEMRHAILVANDVLSRAALSRSARDLKLDMARFDACTDDSSRFADLIRQDVVEGRAAGIAGTPSFVIGRASKGVLSGTRFAGVPPYPVFEGKLQELLAAPALER